MAATTFYAQAAANRRKSALFLFVATLLFLGFGFVVGFAWLGDPVAAIGTTVRHHENITSLTVASRRRRFASSPTAEVTTQRWTRCQ